jgi:hypothetical protein
VSALRTVVAAIIVVTSSVAPALARPASGDLSSIDGRVREQRVRTATPDIVLAQAQTQSPKQEQQQEFTPIEQLPAQEQLPAARLLIVAYAFVLAALFFYVVSVSRRVGAVRREVQRLEADLKRSGRA